MVIIDKIVFLCVGLQDMLWLSYDNIITQLFILNGLIPIIILQLTLNNISPCYKYLVFILSSLDCWFKKHFTDPIYIFIKLVTYLMALLITIINKPISISSNTLIFSQCTVFIVLCFQVCLFNRLLPWSRNFNFTPTILMIY